MCITVTQIRKLIHFENELWVYKFWSYFIYIRLFCYLLTNAKTSERFYLSHVYSLKL